VRLVELLRAGLPVAQPLQWRPRRGL